MQQIVTYITNIAIKRNFVENLPFNANLKTLAKEKRQAGILGEVLFWQQVRNKQFHQLDFDRQRIIGNYIVDFYVKTLGLIVEIDGESHQTKIEYDKQRELYFESLGLKVFKTSDADVKKNIVAVLYSLEQFIIEYYQTTPNPSFGGELEG